jgi:hypothetical protein
LKKVIIIEPLRAGGECDGAKLFIYCNGGTNIKEKGRLNVGEIQFEQTKRQLWAPLAHNSIFSSLVLVYAVQILIFNPSTVKKKKKGLGRPPSPNSLTLLNDRWAESASAKLPINTADIFNIKGDNFYPFWIFS